MLGPFLAPLPLGLFPLLLWALQNSHLSRCRPLGFIRLRADRRKRLIPQGGAEEALKVGRWQDPVLGKQCFPCRVPLGGMLPASGSLPCSFGKVSRLAWCIPYIIHGSVSWRLGYSRIPGTGTALPTRGVRGRQEQLRRAAPGRSHRPSAMPSGGATHGHVPRQTRAQVNSQPGQAAGSGAGSRLLPAQGVISQGPAGAGA